MGMRNQRVNAMGSSGVWVQVEGLWTLQNPYPGYGYSGYRAKKGHPDKGGIPTQRQTHKPPFSHFDGPHHLLQ
jgi:hypothetical protein